MPGKKIMKAAKKSNKHNEFHYSSWVIAENQNSRGEVKRMILVTKMGTMKEKML